MQGVVKQRVYGRLSRLDYFSVKEEKRLNAIKFAQFRQNSSLNISHIDNRYQHEYANMTSRENQTTVIMGKIKEYSTDLDATGEKLMMEII